VSFIGRILLTSVASVISAYVLPGVHIDGFLTAIIVALVLAFLNSIVKPVLILLTIPVTIVTLGLFLLVINAIIIEFAAYLVEGFSVDGFWSALFFSLILSILNAIFIGEEKNIKGGNKQELY